MAFPTINAQQELNNRKILEDLQIKKQLLQKGVVQGVSAIPGLTTVSTTLNNPSYIQLNASHSPNSDTSFINSTSRTAWAQASSQSFGFFIPQDSVFGNNILPVLPRFDVQQQQSQQTNQTSIK